MEPARRPAISAGSDGPAADDTVGWTARRLREDPYEAMLRIAGEIGPRRPTSLAEAKAAAYLDGRLRRAGMSVSADAFRATPTSGWDTLLVALLACLAVALYFWLPLPSLLLSLWNMCLAAVLLRRGGGLIGRRGTSQNVIATRAAAELRRWRVVLLAPLESPPALGRVGRALLSNGRAARGRLIAGVAIVLLAAGGLADLPLEARRALWYAQALPAAYLLVLAGAELRAARAPYSPGAVSHAGALATLLSAAEALGQLESVELWVAALGSVSTRGGLEDMLRRYPFDREETLFIGIEGIGAGSLCFVSGGDGPRRLGADPLILERAHTVGLDPQNEVGPRVYRGGTTLAGALRAAGLRTLGVMCLDAAGRVPLQASAADAPDQVDPALLERAAQFVTALVRQFDQTER